MKDLTQGKYRIKIEEILPDGLSSSLYDETFELDGYKLQILVDELEIHRLWQNGKRRVIGKW